MTVNGDPDLTNFPFFASMPRAELDRLQTRLLRREFRVGQTIFHHATWREAKGDFLAIITNGRVILEASDGILLNIGLGGVLAEELLPFCNLQQYTARAAENTTLWLLRRADWLEIKGQPITPAHHPCRHNQSWLWGLFFFIFLAAAAWWTGPDVFRGLSRDLTQRALQARRPEIATDILQFILRWTPGDAELQDAIGQALFAQGDLQGALTHFRQAVQFDETLALAQNNLGAVLLADDKPREAISYLQAAVDLNPGSPEAFHNLGVAFMMTNQPENACAAFQHAITLDPNNAFNYFYLGVNLDALNRRAEAVVEYQLALAVSNDPEIAELVRARLQ